MVWDNCTQYEINAQEKMQKEDVPIATGATSLFRHFISGNGLGVT